MMDIKITTSFRHGLIEQTELNATRIDLRSECIRRVIDLREQGVREALIKLGWTPPAEPDSRPIRRMSDENRVGRDSDETP